MNFALKELVDCLKYFWVFGFWGHNSLLAVQLLIESLGRDTNVQRSS